MSRPWGWSQWHPLSSHHRQLSLPLPPCFSCLCFRPQTGPLVVLRAGDYRLLTYRRSALQSARACPGEVDQRPGTFLSSQSHPPRCLFTSSSGEGRNFGTPWHLSYSSVGSQKGLCNSSGLRTVAPPSLGTPLLSGRNGGGRVQPEHRNPRENPVEQLPPNLPANCRGQGHGPPSLGDMPRMKSTSNGKRRLSCPQRVVLRSLGGWGGNFQRSPLPCSELFCEL